MSMLQKANMIKMCKGLTMAGMLLSSLCAYGQEDALADASCSTASKEEMHSTMFGVGASTVYDSYLSPIWYEGTDYRIQRERMRATKHRLWGGGVTNQSLIDADIAINENPAGNIDEYAGGVRYSQGWFCDFGKGGNVINPLDRLNTKWNFAVGLQAAGYLGCVYISRSGNNPAQAKVDVMLDASAMATYRLRIFKKDCLMRMQMSLPLVGMAFYPEYGQSYYEMYQSGKYARNMRFAYIGNMPSSRYRVTLDIPFRTYSFRVGYALQTTQARFGNLKYNNTSGNVMFGFNKYFYRK